MKKLTPLKAILYIFGGLILLGLIIALLPVAFLVGGVGTWYYSKRQPNPDKRKKYISLLAIGGIGTALLAPSLSSDKQVEDSTGTATHLVSPSSSSAAKSSTHPDKAKTSPSSSASTSKTETSSKQAQEEKKVKEEARLAEEAAKKAEEERLAAEKAQQEESEKKAAEEARLAEEQRLAEEAAKKAEEERLAAEAQRRAEEEAQAQAAAEAAAAQNQQHGFAQAPASVYYANCSAVKAAGAAPIYAGDPGYASHLDKDGDGIGCER